MITIKDLHVTLPDFALRDIHLAIEENQFFVLMGPTGAGKTVLLEAIAGLVPVRGGKIFIRKREVTGLAPEKRGIGIVYQDHALFPHLTVRENIAYGLHYHRIDGKEAESRFQYLVDTLNISHILKRLPIHLSGGEKQRVALARALIVEPEVLLLDEPLTGLDPNFREEVRYSLKKVHQASRVTFFMVTHDFADAFFLAERVAVINQGRIEQSGTKSDVFQRPASPFVAEFVGMKNVFEAAFHGSKALVGELEIELAADVDETKRYIAIRPEEVLISDRSLSLNGDNVIEGRITSVLDHGLFFAISVRTRDIIIQAWMPKSTLLDRQWTHGAKVHVHLRPSAIHIL